MEGAEAILTHETHDLISLFGRLVQVEQLQNEQLEQSEDRTINNKMWMSGDTA